MNCACPTCGGTLADDDTIRVDSETGIIVARGHVAMLTKQEAAMFDALWSVRPRMLTKEQLLAATADPAFDDRELKIVDVFICKTRKKLKPLGIEIGTVWARAIGSLEVEAMTEIRMDIGDRPTLEWIDVTRIDVDHNYQRDVDGKSVNKILASFRWDHFGAVVLAPKPGGRFNVTDGQHRVKAAQLHPGVTHVPALITSLGDMADEAENFLVINRARRAVSTIEIYWAGLASGDGSTMRIRDVLARAGCEVCAAHGEYRFGHTMAVSAVGRSIGRYGEAATEAACALILTAWPTDTKSLRGTLITALSRVFKANKDLDKDRLSRVLAPKSYNQLTAHAEAFRKLSGGSADTVLARTITELYNKGLSTNTIYFGEAA